MLRERRVGNLRAAVCTFPSPERLGGILDLLAAGYPVKECWLPARLGVLERMACRCTGDWPGWCSLMGATCPPAPGLPETKRHAPAAMLIGLAAAGCPGGPVAVPPSTADPGDYVAAILDGLAVRAAAQWRGTKNGRQAAGPSAGPVPGRRIPGTGHRLLRINHGTDHGHARRGRPVQGRQGADPRGPGVRPDERRPARPILPQLEPPAAEPGRPASSWYA